MNRHRWKLLQIINIGTLMSTLDAGIVNVALPSMSEHFNVGLAEIQWVVSSYLLTLIALLPLLGKWSDRTDRRRMYGWGFVVFTLGSLAVAGSGSFEMFGLITSRCIQGIGAALIMANSQAMVRLLFPDHERGRALGANAVIISIGTLAGPSVGGLLLQWTHWSFLFLINVPFGAATAFLAWRYFPMNESKRKGSIDILGSILLALSTCIFMVVSVEIKKEGYAPGMLAGALAAALLGILFVFYERRIKQGILDPLMYRHRVIAIGNLSGFCIHLIQMATIIPITFCLQTALGFSTGITGGVLSLQAVFMGVSAPIAGRFRDRTSAIGPTVFGPLLCAISTILILWAIDVYTITLFLILSGIGIGCFQATNNAEIMSASPEEKVSLVGSMLALLRYLGMVVGIGLTVFYVGGMNEAHVIENLSYETNMRHLFIICGIIGLAVAAIGLLRPRKKIIQSKQMSVDGKEIIK